MKEEGKLTRGVALLGRCPLAWNCLGSSSTGVRESVELQSCTSAASQRHSWAVWTALKPGWPFRRDAAHFRFFVRADIHGGQHSVLETRFSTVLAY